MLPSDDVVSPLAPNVSGAELDLYQIRSDTRGCSHRVHFNNAGASLPPKCVTDTVVEYLRAEELRGSYELAMERAEELEAAHASVANLVGGQACEVAFLDASTRAWQSALNALPWKKGDRIVTSEAEYPSNVFGYLRLQEKFGVEVHYVGDDASGQIDVAALENALDERTKLITATHIPTYSGLINPVAEVGAVARRANIPFLLDACQSVGQLHLDVNQIGCDMLAAGGRKFLRGPRGTAFLWVRNGLLENLNPEGIDNYSAQWVSADQLKLRGDARRFELYERSNALHLGLGAAAQYATGLGTHAIESRILALGAQLRELLAAVPGVEIHDRGQRLGGIVTFTLRGLPAPQVVTELSRQGINVSLTPQQFAMRAFPARGLTEVVRASVNYYNSEAELEKLCVALRGLSIG